MINELIWGYSVTVTGLSDEAMSNKPMFQDTSLFLVLSFFKFWTYPRSVYHRIWMGEHPRLSKSKMLAVSVDWTCIAPSMSESSIFEPQQSIKWIGWYLLRHIHKSLVTSLALDATLRFLSCFCWCLILTHPTVCMSVYIHIYTVHVHLHMYCITDIMQITRPQSTYTLYETNYSVSSITSSSLAASNIYIPLITYHHILTVKEVRY